MADAPIQPAPSKPLFDYWAVALATFFGSPLAGGIVMAINYRRLGRNVAALSAALAGTALTAVVLLLAFADSSDWMKGLPIGLLFAVLYTAKWLQGPAVEQHVQYGGRLGSRWAAFGIGMAALVLVIGVVVAVVFTELAPHKFIVGSKDEVLYSGNATERDARAVGNALRADGYFQDRGVTVLLAKDDGRVTISFVTKKDSWNDASYVSAFEQVAREVARSVGGLPIRVHLVDSSLDVKKEFTVR
ncbi:MAG TPA: hypothetical protein VMJ34_21815 [Bryobacteraceae bacterium]|nr:hypothetical protein [Bryobacteraceae bacterium]